MTMTAPPLPDFLIIGAQKSATRWLRTNLGRHPEVFTAAAELSFFDHPERVDQLGLDGYRALFAGWSGQRFVGEATPGYMMWRAGPAQIAERIDDSLPGVRLFAVLRNPVDRANSAMLHHIKRRRLPPDADLVALTRSVPPADDPLGLVTGGWYAASLRPFRERFDDRLLVLLHDDVVENPGDVYRRAVEHVGAAPHAPPDELDRVEYTNQRRIDRFKRRVRSGGRAGASSLNQAQRVELYEHFRDDVVELEAMFDLDLGRWDPAGDASDGAT